MAWRQPRARLLHRSPMTLTLLAVSLNERPLSQPITAHFDSRGGTIGRADHNTMALPDPERHVSRLQAEIVANGAAFVIRNVGAANPIIVAGRPVACGETAHLAQGDEIRIGGYLLQADLQMQEAALDVTRGRAMLSASMAPAAPAPGGAEASPLLPPISPTPAVFREALPRTGSGGGNNPFADLLGGPAAAPAADPFADMFGSPLGARPSGAGGPRTPFMASPPPAPPTAQPPQPLPSAAAPAPLRPAANLADDPFADLMPPPAGVLPSSAALAPGAPGPGAGAGAGAAARLPDDFDPFAPLAASTPALAPAKPVDPFADLMPASAPSSIDTLFGLDPGAPDPLANFMAKPMPAGGGAAPQPGGHSADPLEALFGDAPAQPPQRGPVQHDHLPALNAAYQPPRVVAAMQPPLAASRLAPPPAGAPYLPPGPAPAAPAFAPPAHVPPAFATPVSPPFTPPVLPPVSPPSADLPLTFDSAIAPAPLAPAHVAASPAAPMRSTAPPTSLGAVDEADAQRLWAALCQGAQMQLPLPPGSAEESMRELGRILRSAVDGTLRLMAVRASTKHELRADITVIQARGNNPLKFSPDAKSGLEYLLQPAMRGFLEGSAAMDDAMQDLVGHSIGTVAGMRAAIAGMLDRFGPEQLEAKLSGKSVLDSVLPINRKAKLWDLYLQHHDAIREEAQEDFHSLFGKAFLAAYEQQVAQLRRNNKGS